MAEYSATIAWERQGADFLDRKYSRAHRWTFDGGAIVPASSSPHVVRAPMSDPSGVDPEEAFVASLSSCHMLWFLDLAARADWVVDEYRDVALGRMAKNAQGKLAMTLVVLRPEVWFTGRQPPAEEFSRLHHQAHEECFIAASVMTEVRCEPQLRAR
ncbi:MAG TPA: OsmC family protein [Steroidobacteraceae bacterium]|nr:OsmC family protein [Steroidobacteraceae bacterium]